MIAKALIKQFQYNHFVMQKNLEGISHEDSVAQPGQYGNCINWVLGHIVWTRNFILKLVNEPPILTGKESEVYKQGAEALRDLSNAVPFETVKNLFEDSQKTIADALGNLSDEDYGRIQDENGDTLAEQLAGLSFHESYHAGQIGVIRRVIGKEGVLT